MTTHLSRIHSVTVGPGKCPLVDILLSGVAQYLHYRSITPPHFPPREAIEKVGDGDTFRDKSIGSRSFRAKVMNLAIRAGPLAVTCVGLLLKGWKTSPSFSRKLFWFSNTFILLGAGLRLYCFKVLGKYFTFALAVQDDQKVIKKGPYSLVRHPSYTGFLVESIGTLATGYITNPLIPPQLTFLGVILALWQGFSEWVSTHTTDLEHLPAAAILTLAIVFSEWS
ncbi:unnamed protein product [Sympodiomycopsis kandeliae]